ncbi:hypothetical protein N8940_00645 [Sphingomonadaceae bacterium]|nr:hypothetical protein [Sphingomonadaceae bacterium]
MYAFVFRNKIAALLFVGMILFGVANLVGTEDRQGLLQKGVATFEGEKAGFQDDIDRLGSSGEQHADAGPSGPTSPFDDAGSADSSFFADDGDLIDDASGFDPSADIGEYAPQEEGEIIGTVVPEPPMRTPRRNRGSRPDSAPERQPNNGLIPESEALRINDGDLAPGI